jgi:hypothetical protein
VIRAIAVTAVAAGIAVAAAIGACFVSNPTDALKCGSNMTCATGRTCQQGYCVVSAIGAGSCASACTSCDLTTTPPTCNFTGANGAGFTCPDGYACTITCGATGACGAITCGNESCSVDCEGSDACGAIDCSASCGCDVTCSSGDCGTETCPQGSSCISGSNCDSSLHKCNKC